MRKHDIKAWARIDRFRRRLKFGNRQLEAAGVIGGALLSDGIQALRRAGLTHSMELQATTGAEIGKPWRLLHPA